MLGFTACVTLTPVPDSEPTTARRLRHIDTPLGPVESQTCVEREPDFTEVREAGLARNAGLERYGWLGLELSANGPIRGRRL